MNPGDAVMFALVAFLFALPIVGWWWIDRHPGSEP